MLWARSLCMQSHLDLKDSLVIGPKHIYKKSMRNKLMLVNRQQIRKLAYPL